MVDNNYVNLPVANKLGITPSDLREKPNPQGEGSFVYVPKTEFVGVERFIFWMVIDNQAYPLNGATKDITPTLFWPREALVDTWQKTGLDRFSPAIEGIDIVFRGGTPPTPPPTAQKPSSSGSFTVMEYRLYRAVIDTPMSISESEAIPRIARDYNVTPQQVRDAGDEVMMVLFENDWLLDTPESQIQHASDWAGERQHRHPIRPG